MTFNEIYESYLKLIIITVYEISGNNEKMIALINFLSYKIL